MPDKDKKSKKRNQGRSDNFANSDRKKNDREKEVYYEDEELYYTVTEYNKWEGSKFIWNLEDLEIENDERGSNE